jgi:hypothetical protein
MVPVATTNMLVRDCRVVRSQRPAITMTLIAECHSHGVFSAMRNRVPGLGLICTKRSAGHVIDTFHTEKHKPQTELLNLMHLPVPPSLFCPYGIIFMFFLHTYAVFSYAGRAATGITVVRGTLEGRLSYFTLRLPWLSPGGVPRLLETLRIGGRRRRP